MKLASKLSHKLSRKLAIKPFGYSSSLSNSELVVPASLKQLLFHDNNVAQPAYYTPQELEGSGLSHDAYLKDYALGKGSLRPKRQGYCYNFDGVNDYVESGNLLIVDVPVTLSCWVNFDNIVGEKRLVTLRSSDTSEVISLTVLNNNLYLQHYLSTGINVQAAYSNVLFASQWLHIVGVFTNNASRQAFINGVPLALNTTVASTLIAPKYLILGTWSRSSQFLDGKLSDVQIYNYALTAQQVADLYAGTLPATKPIAHYPLQEESGPRAYDISGNGYHGTIMNATTSGVGSIHVADAGVKKSYPNDEGYTPAFTLKGDATSQALIYKANGKTVDISFKIKTTDSIGILFANASGGLYFLYWNNTQAGQPLYNSYGTPSVYVDDVLYTDRALLSAALADGEKHDVVIQNVTLSHDTYINGYFTGTGTTGVIADVWDLIIDGVPIPGPTLIPNVSDTESAIGTTPQFTGRVPQYGLAKGPAWQGDGSSVYVDLGSPIIPATADFELELWYYHTTNDTTRKWVLEQWTNASTGRLSLLANSNNGLSAAGFLQLGIDTNGVNINSLVENTWHKIKIARSGSTFTLFCTPQNSATISSSVTFAGSILQVNTTLFNDTTSSLPNNGRLGPVTITTGGVTTTYSPIQGTRNVAVTKSDGTYSVINNAVVNGTLANLYTTGNGSWKLPAIENGAHWDGTSLIPAAPGAEVAANGNAKNIPANKHPRSVLVDRTGAVITPLDTAMGTDDLTNETWEQGVAPLGKRYFTNYSDRHGAGLVDVSALDYFEPRAFVARVGTSTSPTSTGTKAVTGIGFQPKAIVDLWSFISANVNEPDLYNGFGAATPFSQAAIGCFSRSNVTTSSTFRRHSSSALITAISPSATVFEEASRLSFDADGFTRSWNPTFAAAQILNHIALGGADLEVSLTQHQMNATNAPQSFAHGLTGGEPTALLCFSAVSGNIPPNTTPDLLFNIGCWANGSQFAASVSSQNGLTTTSTSRRLSTTDIYCFHFPSLSPVVRRTFAVSSVDSANVNVTYPVTNVNFQQYFWMLAIRGAKAQVGTFDCNGSLDPLTIATPGITPKLFLPVLVRNGVSGINTVQNFVFLTIGASDGINNVSCGITDANAVTTTNARRYQSSNSIIQYDQNGGKYFEATASFLGESVIVNPTLIVTSQWGQGGYLILGE